MKVAVGILCTDAARFTDFAISMTALQAPPQTQLLWAKGVDIAGNSNKLCEVPEKDWLWIMGDDHTFEPDILMKLMAHDKDVIVPLCLKRSPPYAPVVYSGQDKDGLYVPLELPEKEGLVPIYAAGTAGMLIKQHVLDAIEPPWFYTEGKWQNEDLNFCRKVREAGFEIWCDTSIALGHIAIMTVSAKRIDGKWMTMIDLGEGNTLAITQVPPVKE